VADEALLRIKLDEGAAGPRSSPTRPYTPPSQPYYPTATRPAGGGGQATKLFDPYEEAMRRRQSEVQREQTKAAYEDLYGDVKSSLDVILEVAEHFRGTLGGAFGSILGAALDAAAAFREMSKRQTAREVVVPELEPYVPPVEPPTLEEYIPAKKPYQPPRFAEQQPEGPAVEPPTLEEYIPAKKPYQPPRFAEQQPEGPAYKDVKQAFDERDARALPGPKQVQPANRGVAPPSRGVQERTPRVEHLGTTIANRPQEPPAPEMLVAGEAEGAAAGGMAMAEAVPIAGAILAVLIAVDKAMQGVRDNAVSAARSLGDFAVKIATPGNTFGQDAQMAGDAIHTVGDKMWKFAPFISAVTSVTGEAISSLGRFSTAVDAAAQHYAQYSPVLAQAQAVAEMRQVYGDFRRAQMVGTNLAKYTLAKSKLEQDVEDLKASVLDSLLPTLTKIVEVADNLLQTGTASNRFLQGMIGGVVDLRTEAEKATDIINAINRAIEREAMDKLDPTTTILDMNVAEPPV
jgi:hypothetical protein